MVRRYELPDAAWELIKIWFPRSRRWDARVVMIGWYSTASSGFCALEPLGATCQNASAVVDGVSAIP